MTIFVETRATLTVRAGFDTAVKMRYPVLAVGKAGLGKTVALNWIAAQSGAAYCEVAQHTKAIRPMFLMLHDAYGVQKDSKHTYDLAKDCMNFLGAGYGPTRPLLVDEYQNFTPTVLRELLHLQERCGFALLLAGNTHRLAGTRRDIHAMDQIESRIGMRFEIGQPTREDCVRIGSEHTLREPTHTKRLLSTVRTPPIARFATSSRTALPLPTALAAFVFLGSRPRFVSCRAAAMRSSFCTSAERTSEDRLNSGQRQVILNGTRNSTAARSFLKIALLRLRPRIRSRGHLPVLPPRC